ncbi:MAG: hypothetical protein AAB452_02340 [Patescibacteria group bacterium]
MARLINLRPQPDVKKEPLPMRVASVLPPQEEKIENTLEVHRPAVLSRKDIPATTFAWEAHPHQEKPKSNRHLTIFVAVIVGLAALVWYFQGNILFACFLLLAALTIIAVSRREVKEIAIRINAEGVAIHDAFHPFKSLKSFWIDYTPGGTKELSLEISHWYLPYVKVPLGSQNPNHVRDFLLEFIPEEEHEISLIEALARFSSL